MAEFPLAYHVTWGTYGARLHGSAKPHVDREHRAYGAPLVPIDPQREAATRARMRQEPVSLSLEQRRAVREAIYALCARYGWPIHEFAGQSDHTHVVVSADREGRALREALKAAASRELNRHFGKRKWWAEGGSSRYVWDERYLADAINYVRGQRDF